jgi:hypothetical protein
MSKQNQPEAAAPSVCPGRAGLAFAALLACACSDHVVQLGEISQDVTVDGHCQVSQTGAILVENQAQLDQLAGCRQIDGDLFVRPFTGVDFTPLASLRVVQGKLDLGRYSVFDPIPETDSEGIDALYDAQQVIVNSGWMTSLAGLEQLERVGSLSLSGLSAPSLEPLSNLRALTGTGTLEIGPCSSLTDLHGLEGLSGLVDFISSCASLVSLHGLTFPTRIRNLQLMADQGIPLSNGEHTQLADLTGLDVEEVANLRIESSALTSFAGLEQLRQAKTMFIYSNPLLVDLSALNSLESVDDLTVQEDARLEQLPDFSSLRTLRTLQVGYNDSLASIGSFGGLMEDLEIFGVAHGDTLDPHELSADVVSQHRPDDIEISYNPSLRHLSFPEGWVKAGYVSIAGNEQLESVEFSTLYSIDRLAIVANPLLDQLDLGNLRRADELYLGGTPALLQALAELPAFERTIVAPDGTPLTADAPPDPAPAADAPPAAAAHAPGAGEEP